MENHNRKIEDVPFEERRNWPVCRRNSNEFVTYDESPIVGRKMWNNEEVAFLVRFRRDEYLWELGIDPTKATREQLKEKEQIAKVDILDSIYPLVNLRTFRQDNPDLRDKCCRYIFQVPLVQIASKHFVQGEGLKFINNTMGADEDWGTTEDDPKWGWDLTKPEEGFPCINLTAAGCSEHNKYKPWFCTRFPFHSKNIGLIPDCGYSFDAQGVRLGSCTRCR